MKAYIWVLLFLVSCGVSETASQLAAHEPSTEADMQAKAESSKENARLEVVRDFESLDKAHIANRIDKSVDLMVNTALAQLRQHGRADLAIKHEAMYKSKYYFYWSTQMLSGEDLGDHAPYSQWLADLYKDIEAVLGKPLCELLHLDDINVVNYAVTVVFDPKNPEWDVDEYRLHFVPLAGVCAYWTAYIACSVLTYGAGAAFLLCSPVAVALEVLVVNHIAPPISDRVYYRWNNQE